MNDTRSKRATALKRVLIVHYHFLPVHNVAVKRLVSYARRLSAWGWQPVVLTREWHGIEDQHPSWGLSWEPDIAERVEFPIHSVPAPRVSCDWRVPERAPGMLRKAVSLARLLFGAYPDEFVGWIRPAVKAATALARSEPFDAVITYCPPETNHIVGQRLARVLGVPWIPFFGDLWEFFLAQFPSSPRGLIRKAYHHWWMSSAAACVGVSPYMVDYLARTYRKRVELVLTGYDPEEFAHPQLNPARSRERLVVSHVGSLYPLDQKPGIFFDGLDELLRRHPQLEPRLEVRFIGSKCDQYLKDLIRDRPCGRVCSVRPKVDSAAAVALVQDSDALLAFNCTVHRAQHGTMSYPSKIFEAFGARRPILAIPPDGDWVDSLLARTGGGTTARDAQEVAEVFWDWFSSWDSKGVIPYLGRPEALEAYTVGRQVERLAALLDSAVAPTGG